MKLKYALKSGPIGGFILLVGLTLTSCGPEKYDLYHGKEAVSPDGKTVAAFYTISGGGAAGYVLTRLKIRPKSQTFKEDNDYVFELRHGTEIDLKWQGNNQLVVVYEAGADVHRQWDSRENVKISYVAKKLPANW